MSSKSKTEFRGLDISTRADWPAWEKDTLEQWADLAGELDPDKREVVKEQFRKLVASNGVFNDWEHADATRLHNYLEWSKDQRQRYSGAAKIFCQQAKPPASDILTIFRTLSFNWGELSDLDKQNEFSTVSGLTFEQFYDANSEDSMRDQVALFLKHIEERLDKLPEYFPNQASRDALCYSRLTCGMGKTFQRVCRECRNDPLCKTPDQVLVRLQDECTEQSVATKSEKNASPVYFTQEQLEDLKKKEREAGRKAGKKAGKKAAAKAAAAYYAAPPGNKAKGGGKKGKGKKGADRRKDYDNAPYARKVPVGTPRFLNAVIVASATTLVNFAARRSATRLQLEKRRVLTAVRSTHLTAALFVEPDRPFPVVIVLMGLQLFRLVALVVRAIVSILA